MRENQAKASDTIWRSSKSWCTIVSPDSPNKHHMQSNDAYCRPSAATLSHWLIARRRLSQLVTQWRCPSVCRWSLISLPDELSCPSRKQILRFGACMMRLECSRRQVRGHYVAEFKVVSDRVPCRKTLLWWRDYHSDL